MQRNIASFGGDPARVTIMGCSSGGTSVWNLLASPLSRGLFQRAMPLSSASRNNVTLAQAEADNRAFSQYVGCAAAPDPYGCLLGLPLQRVMAGLHHILNHFPFWSHPDFQLPAATEYDSGLAIVDGVVVPAPLHTALRDPALHLAVPVLAGSNSQEGASHALPENATAAQYATAVHGFVQNISATTTMPPDAAQRLLQLYPADGAEFRARPKAALDAMVADIRVVCGTNDNARRLVESQKAVPAAAVPVWHVYADLRSTSADRAGHCHMFGTLISQQCDQQNCTKVDLDFHRNMIEVTMAFVTNGSVPFRMLGDTPGNFTNGSYMLGDLNEELGNTQDRLRARCDFWRTTGVLEQYAWDE